jgi:hypothetical protein
VRSLFTPVAEDSVASCSHPLHTTDGRLERRPQRSKAEVTAFPSYNRYRLTHATTTAPLQLTRGGYLKYMYSTSMYRAVDYEDGPPAPPVVLRSFSVAMSTSAYGTWHCPSVPLHCSCIEREGRTTNAVSIPSYSTELQIMGTNMKGTSNIPLCFTGRSHIHEKLTQFMYTMCCLWCFTLELACKSASQQAQ